MRLLMICIFFILSSTVYAGPFDETRICGEPARDANGRIARSSEVLTAFKRIHPCPSTGLSTGACKGWAIDHVIPLACGGCDAVGNLQWLPNKLKSCAGDCKDRWERKINCSPMQTGIMP